MDVENGTFSGCTSLSKVVFGEDMEEICQSAFSGCSAIKEIYACPILPPTITDDEGNEVLAREDAFESTVYKKAKLYVANTNRALDRYLGDEQWQKFLNIEARDLTGIETPTIAPIPAKQTFYNLQGQRIAAPTRGINVVNGKKMLVH